MNSRNRDFDSFIKFCREIYSTSQDFIPLHQPRFRGNEKKYLNNCIDSTFVSSVGPFVDQFEKDFSTKTSSPFSVAVVNGTAALHTALHYVGADKNSEVLTQSLTFIATANAIHYTGATPVFIDVDHDSLGMSPVSLEEYLHQTSELRDNVCFNKNTNKKIVACVPMHTFGNPCRIDELSEICKKYHIEMIEDCAESLGSFYKSKHTGTFGLLGAFSFNGNKIITSGGGGIITCPDQNTAKRLKHTTTTAKKPHPFEFNHDEVGFNYRMPNINAALACAQLEQIDQYLLAKKKVFLNYQDFFNSMSIKMVQPIKESHSNHWLNAIFLKNNKEKDYFLNHTNKAGIMTRPLWTPMHLLPIYKDCPRTNMTQTENCFTKVVNIPSSLP